MGKLLSLKISAPNKAAIIDEFGDISLRRIAFAPTEARHKQLTDELKTWYPEVACDHEFVEKGARFQLAVSARANEKTINIYAAYKKLGLKKFLRACSLTLKALAAELSEPEVNQLVTTSQSGSRRFVATPIGQPAPPAAA